MRCYKLSVLKTPQQCGECGSTFFRKNKQEFCSYKCSAANRGRNLTPEQREARSQQQKQRYKDQPELRAVASEKMRQQALYDHKFRAAVKERMTTRNPGANPEIKQRAQATKIARGVTYEHLTGGNGTGPTRSQKMLSEALGWPMEVAVATGQKRPSGYPAAYKLDVSDPHLLIGVECDGQTHKSPTRRAQDQKKTALLESMGWTILRFWNHEIESDLSACVEQVQAAVLKCSTLKLEQETTLRKAS